MYLGRYSSIAKCIVHFCILNRAVVAGIEPRYARGDLSPLPLVNVDTSPEVDPRATMLVDPGRSILEGTEDGPRAVTLVSPHTIVDEKTEEIAATSSTELSKGTTSKTVSRTSTPTGDNRDRTTSNTSKTSSVTTNTVKVISSSTQHTDAHLSSSSTPARTAIETITASSTLNSTQASTKTLTSSTPPSFVTSTSIVSTIVVPSSVDQTTVESGLHPTPSIPESQETLRTSAKCLPGTSCSVILGVGLGAGCAAFLIAFLVVGGRYRKFLAVSQQSYRDHRNRGSTDNHLYDNAKACGDVNMSIFNQSHNASPPPRYHQNGLFLPQDVQRVVQSVDQMRQQRLRVPLDTYGSISRKPLPKSTNF